MDSNIAGKHTDALLETTQLVLDNAISRFPQGQIAISFSGAEDVVLIDIVDKLGMRCDVFSLDTGRLPAETYEFIEKVRTRYDVNVDMLLPDPDAVAALVRSKGLFSFYTDGHGECCGVRKIEPLRKKLRSLDAWITGQRRDQSVTRIDLPNEQNDAAFSTEEHQVVKFNPLADWQSSDIWRYIRDNDVPYNDLHDRGFVSIGCQPCTRPIGPAEHERAGRWWWEEATKKECGLHSQNVVRILDNNQGQV